jgi:adenylate cyclase
MGACVTTDAERFTSVAERIGPAAAVECINRYFEVLFRPVYDNGGFISDVKGDGALAIWAEFSPDPELRAKVCRACLEMAGNAAQFHRRYPEQGWATRIGAYFGPIALATVGALEHYEYRAVGDTVNTSSRLEELNKRLGTRLLVSAELVEGLDEFLYRDLGEFELRGKQRRVRVCELVARRDEASDRQLRLCEDFAAAMLAQCAGRLEEAHSGLVELCARHPEDGPSRFQLRRCRLALAEVLPRAGAGLPFTFALRAGEA